MGYTKDALQGLANAIVAATSSLRVTIAAGAQAIGKLAANSGVDIGDVTVNNAAGAAAVNVQDGGNTITVDGTVAVSGAAIPAVATGGATPYKNIDVDESEDQISASACTLYTLHAMNMKAAPLYLKLYNATAATVVVGTTVPDFTFPLPTQSATVNGGGFCLNFGTVGAAFSTALTIACTTGVADNDSGAPGANECIVNLTYK